MIVHVAHQAVVLVAERQLGVQILRNRTAHTEKTVLFFGFFDVGNDPDFFLEIVQFDQPELQVVDFFGKFLNLLALTDDFIHLAGDHRLFVLKQLRSSLEMIIVVGDETDRDHATDQKKSQDCSRYGQLLG